MTRHADGLRVLIVDDEEAAIVALTDLLANHPGVKILGSASGVGAARSAVEKHGGAVDVVFLDVEMPKSNGFDLVASLVPTTRVVFVTAYDDYAVEAFEVGASDYLLKPVTAERLALCLSRLEAPLRSCRDSPGVLSEPGSGWAVRPLATIGGQTMLVDDRQILWIEASRNHSEIHVAARAACLVQPSIATLESMLPRRAFARISRSVIVSLDRIETISWRSQGGTKVRFHGSDEILSLGRAGSDRLKMAVQTRFSR